MRHFGTKLLLFLLAILLSGCFRKDAPTDPVTSDPQIPVTPIPADKAIDQLTAVQLQWESTGAQSYDIYFGAVNPPPFFKNVTDKSVTLTSLVNSTTYYWQVKANITGTNFKLGPVWSFTTKAADPFPGYKTQKYLIESKLPCFVNILFQVTDLNGNGIPGLLTQDFEVQENFVAVSPTESAMHIKKKDQIPYVLKTVLMLDNSTSIAAELAQIKAAAMELVNGIVPRQEIAVYKFSDGPVLVQDFTDNKSVLQAAINSIDMGFATTDLYGSVITGVSRWDDLYSISSVVQGFLVLLTDGNDTQGRHTFGEAMNARGMKKVIVVGLGDEIQPAILTQIGNAGFYPIDEAGSLSAKFAEIQQQLSDWANSFYWLNYMSPKRGNNTHQLKLAIKNNPYLSSDGYIVGEFNSKDFYSVSGGVYVNADSLNPYGVTNTTIPRNGTRELSATTYLSYQVPRYTWSSGDTAIIKISGYSTDSSTVTLTATGNPGQSTGINVRDEANNYSAVVNVLILNTGNNKVRNLRIKR